MSFNPDLDRASDAKGAGKLTTVEWSEARYRCEYEYEPHALRILARLNELKSFWRPALS